jgi:hypothetical protein
MFLVKIIKELSSLYGPINKSRIWGSAGIYGVQK